MPGVAEADPAALRAQAVGRIRDWVQPAYRELLAFMRNEYLPGTRTTLSAYDLPDGRAYYRAKIREYTTLDYDPEAIYALGESEVARLHGEMLDIMNQTGFKGDFPAFLVFLRAETPSSRLIPRKIYLDARCVDRQEVRRQGVAILRPSAAGALHHRAGSRRSGAVLYGRPRRPGTLSVEYL